MRNIIPREPIDYLIIGHLTRDLTPNGPTLGGTAAYASLTAHKLGLRVGLVTSWAEDVPLGPMEAIPIANFASEHTTTFENVYTKGGRIQIIHEIAPSLNLHHIPESWRSAPIVHLGPIAQEVEPGLVRYFPSSLIGLTPQGWLRSWDVQGHVSHSDWLEAGFVLGQAGAVVISTEDVDNNEDRIDELATYCRVLAVTEAEHGARLYWNGDVRRFRPPMMDEVDATGAGDVFAAAFFSRLHSTRDPWEAARFATLLSAYSVTRMGMDSVPTSGEIDDSMVEVI